MRLETQLFLDALAVIRGYADWLLDEALLLTPLDGSPPRAPTAYGGRSTDDGPQVAGLLREAARQCLTRAEGIERDLAAHDALGATASVSSCMFSVDLYLSENLPGIDRDTVPRLYSHLSPVYDRIERQFDLATEPPDDSKMHAYSHWLATHPNPWNGG